MTKEERREYNKRYYQANRLRIKDQQAVYRKGVDYAEYQKYYQEQYQQSPKYRESIKKYQESSKYRDAQKLYQRGRKDTDPAFKFITNLRSRHSKVLQGKASTTAELGCSAQDLRDYLQAQWSAGMTWNNYGHGPDKWTIDHKLPLSSCERLPTGEWDPTSEYNKQLIHYTNLQPMWYIDNVTKGDCLSFI